MPWEKEIPERQQPDPPAWGDPACAWRDAGIRLGDQAALVSLVNPTSGCVWLSVAHHPGETVSRTQAEARLGLQPHRRTDLLRQRLTAFEQHAMQQAREHLTEAEQHVQATKPQVEALEQDAQIRKLQQRPTSRLAQAEGACRQSPHVPPVAGLHISRRTVGSTRRRPSPARSTPSSLPCKPVCCALSRTMPPTPTRVRSSFAWMRAVVSLRTWHGWSSWATIAPPHLSATSVSAGAGRRPQGRDARGR